MSWGTGRYEERQLFVNREALSGTVSSGDVWPVKCVTCLSQRLQMKTITSKFSFVIFCVVTRNLWFNQQQIKNIQKGQEMWFSGRMLLWHAKCEYTSEGYLAPSSGPFHMTSSSRIWGSHLEPTTPIVLLFRGPSGTYLYPCPVVHSNGWSEGSRGLGNLLSLHNPRDLWHLLSQWLA